MILWRKEPRGEASESLLVRYRQMSAIGQWTREEPP
jgi:hypothetical protein